MLRGFRTRLESAEPYPRFEVLFTLAGGHRRRKNLTAPCASFDAGWDCGIASPVSTG